MSAAYSDRNLLFGVLALQMDFIVRDALIAALHAWVLDKTRTLGHILVAQQILNPDERDVLDALVQKHLDRHRGNIDKSLAAVALSAPLREELRRPVSSTCERRQRCCPFSPRFARTSIGSSCTSEAPDDNVRAAAGWRFPIARPVPSLAPARWANP
jgi:hypothetical protein